MLVRHRKAKAPATDRLHLHHRATSRLYPVSPDPGVPHFCWVRKKIMNTFTFWAALIAVSFVPSVASSADTEANAYQKGIASLEKQDYDAAVAAFTEAIRVNPKSADAFYKRGSAYARKGDSGKAVADYTEAIRLDPKYVAAYINRGAAYERNGAHDKAIPDYTEAIRLNPNDALPYCNRGAAYMMKGDREIAVADYTKAIRLNPKDDTAYYNRGLAYADGRQYDKAIGDFSVSIRLNAKFSLAYYRRGIAYDNKGEYDNAVADLTESIRLDAKFQSAYFRRGVVHQEKGELAKAIADYNRAFAINPNNAQNNAVLCTMRGNALRAQGEYDKAIADYDRALAIDPKFGLAYESLGWLRATCPNEKYRDGIKAVENASKACQLDDKGWGNFDALAAAYAESRDFDKAKQWQEKANEMARSDKSVTEQGRRELRSRLELFKQGRPYRDEPTLGKKLHERLRRQ